MSSFNFVCFCYLSIFPSVDNQSLFFPFQPFPFQFSFLMVPLLPICAFLCSFSHLLLVFLPSLSHLPTARTSFPPVCFQCQWHYSVAHGSGWLEYVMGSYQARQKTRKKESVTERRGTRQENLWRTESTGEKFAAWIQILSFTLQYKSSAPPVQGVLSVSEQEQPGLTKVVWERYRNIKKQRQNTASIQRNGLGKGGIPIWWEERQNQKGKENQKLKEQRRQQTQVISTLWLCCIDTKMHTTK